MLARIIPLCLGLLIFFHSLLRAEDEWVEVSESVLSADFTDFGQLPLVSNWRFHPDDRPSHARPEFDDSSWQRLDSLGTLLNSDSRGKIGWNGMGWFRLHLKVHPDMRERLLALHYRHAGAVEIYLDGEVLYSLGIVGRSRKEEHGRPAVSPRIIFFRFDSREEHVIAVRYSNFWIIEKRMLDQLGSVPGFGMVLADPEKGIDHQATMQRYVTIHQMLFAVPLAFAVLHFLMFLFCPELRGNLYYALFAAATAMMILAPFQYSFLTNPDPFWYWHLLFMGSIVLTALFGLRFLYHEFPVTVPRFFRVVVAVGVLILIFAWIIPERYVYYYYAVALFPEVLRLTYIGIRKRMEGACLMALGWLAFALCCGYQLLLSIQVISNDGLFLPYIYGILVLLFSMSAHLARSFARLNRDLRSQLVRVEELSAQTLEQERRARAEEVARKQLEAENALKNKELEEARKRQEVLDELERTNLELRETQGHLVQSAKMAALGNLVAGITHEINSPVGAIQSMQDTVGRAVDRLKETLVSRFPQDYEKDSGIRRPFEVIVNSSRVISQATGRVTEIMRNLRSFARLDEAEFQVANLEEGLDSTLAVMGSQVGSRISVVKEYEGIDSIFCSPGQLNQVFMHLLKNATQAISDRGEIRIITSQDQEKVHVRIRDTGVGIPPEQLDHIFDLGFRAGGERMKMGLGLVADYNIVQAHRGGIQIQSEVGTGTEVTVSLLRRKSEGED